MSEFKLLKQVRALIEDETNGFIMSEYHCGTAACIVGWANKIMQAGDGFSVGGHKLTKEGVPSALFYTSYWPASYQDAIMEHARNLGWVTDEPEDHEYNTDAATIYLESSDEDTQFLRHLALALIDGVIANNGAMPDDDFPLPSGVDV